MKMATIFPHMASGSLNSRRNAMAAAICFFLKNVANVKPKLRTTSAMDVPPTGRSSESLGNV